MHQILKMIFFLSILMPFMSFGQGNQNTVVKFRLHRGTGTEAGLFGATKKLYFFAFPDKKSFEADEGILVEATPLPDDPETYVATNLKPGKYTFSAYEDSNKNGQHDKNFAGMPKEPFAISKVVKRLWAQPDWEETSCQIDEGQSVVLDMLFKFQ